MSSIQKMLIDIPDLIKDGEPYNEIDFSIDGVEYMVAFDGQVELSSEIVDIENGRHKNTDTPKVRSIIIERVLLSPSDSDHYEVVETLPQELYNLIRKKVHDHMVENSEEFIYQTEPIFENQ